MLFQQLVNGLALGGVYGLIGIGWTTVWGIVGMINWTQSEVFMIGGFAGFFMLGLFHHNYIAALILGAVIAGVVAVILDRGAYYPLRASKAPRLSIMITALGASVFLKYLMTILFSPDPRTYPAVVNQKVITLFSLGGTPIMINNLQLLIFASQIVIMAGLQLFITRTRTGKAMLAASQDAESVSLMGASVEKLIMFTFLLSGLLGGAAGVLVGTLYAIDPSMGSIVGIKGWEAAVLGGMGSIPGSMVAGLLLGMIENLTSAYVSTNYREAIGFLIMILVLLFKPSGLMGYKYEKKV